MAEPVFELWLEFEAGIQDEGNDPALYSFDPENDFFNMIITLGSGERYGLNVWTYNYLQSARRQAEQSGENLKGAYLLTPDLLVRRCDRGELEAIVREMIRTGQLYEQWRMRSDYDPPGAIEDAEDPIFAAFMRRMYNDPSITILIQPKGDAPGTAEPDDQPI
jgi:hypothetical protein